MAEGEEITEQPSEPKRPLSRADVRAIVQASLDKLRAVELAELARRNDELRAEFAAVPTLTFEDVAEHVRDAVEKLRAELAATSSGLSREEVKDLVRGAMEVRQVAAAAPVNPATTPATRSSTPATVVHATSLQTATGATGATVVRALPASAVPPGVRPRQEEQPQQEPQRFAEDAPFEHPVPVEPAPAPATAKGGGAAIVAIFNNLYGGLEKAQRAALVLPEGEDRELLLSRITALRRGVAEAAKPFTT